MLRNLLTATALTFSALPVVAQNWSGQATPYVWGSGVYGDITPYAGAPTLSFDNSLSDVMEHLDGAFFLSGFARRDRLVIMGDLSWSSSSADGVVPVPGVGPAPASGKLTQRSATLLAGYRAVSNDQMTLDLLAGARGWSIKGSVTVASGAKQASPEKDFVDPILALRANIALAPRWSALLYADVGGFGVGSESTSQIVATANYQGERESLGFGRLADAERGLPQRRDASGCHHVWSADRRDLAVLREENRCCANLA